MVLNPAVSWAVLAPAPPTSLCRIYLMDWWTIMGFSLSQQHPDPEKSCVSVPFMPTENVKEKKRPTPSLKQRQKDKWLTKDLPESEWRKVPSSQSLESLCVHSHQKATWSSSLPACFQSTTKRLGNQKTEWKEKILQDYSTSEASLSEGR